LELELTDHTDADVVTAIARVTRGNFRLVERLFAQIERVVQINDVPAIPPEIVAVASESLVIGPIWASDLRHSILTDFGKHLA
jgi:hypothetical protein